NASNNTAQVCVLVSNPTTGADVAVTKNDAPDPVTIGSNLTYIVRVHNSGPLPATGVVLTDALPEGVVFVSASEGCTESDAVVTCPVGNLAVKGSVTETIIVTVTNLPGQICNSANVTATETDPLPENNTVTACTEITATPAPVHDLALTKIVAPKTIVLS